MTCFGGGSHQAFVNEILSSLNANFIISAEGTDETSTFGSNNEFISVPENNRLILLKQPFSDFFRLLNLFIDQPEKFVKVKGKNIDPLVEILGTVVSNMTETNQPSIRFPSAGVFKALALDSNVKVLTNALVKAHELERKPIDISNTPITTLIIYPSRINVPLDIGKDIRSIIMPMTKIVAPTYNAMYEFKKIHCGITLQEFLFNLIYRNARLHTQTFVVKELTGILLNNSGLIAGPQRSIHNLIVQVKGMLGTNKSSIESPPILNRPVTAQDIKFEEMGGNAQVTFELDGTIYQCLIPIKNFEILAHEEELFNQTLYDVFTTIVFKPEAANIDMESVARKFLRPADMTTIQKPITLEAITKVIESQIDRQQ